MYGRKYDSVRIGWSWMDGREGNARNEGREGADTVVIFTNKTKQAGNEI